MKTILFESMTKHRIPSTGCVIRCWRQEAGYSPHIAKQSRDEIVDAIKALNITKPTELCARQLLNLERMNAVEILNAYGDGVVVYKNWP